MQSSLLTAPSLAHRLACPTPAARAERDHLRRSRRVQRCRAEIGRMLARMSALRDNQYELRQLTEIARAAAPDKTAEAAWPAGIAELADKIERQESGQLAATEAPVRSRDRKVILDSLPPCVQVQRNDPARN